MNNINITMNNLLNFTKINFTYNSFLAFDRYSLYNKDIKLKEVDSYGKYFVDLVLNFNIF